MNEKVKYLVDSLTEQSVSVASRKAVIMNGEEYEIGQLHRKAYINTESGREEVMEEVPDPQRSAIFAVWGDSPTIEEKRETEEAE